jgi:hypothetical protein
MILTEGKISELNEKYKELIGQNPEWITASDRRNKQHIVGVQTFGKKLGYEFADHDADKLDMLYVPYILISLGYNKDFNKDFKIDKEMDDFMRWATYSHVTNNPHHPEHWDLEAAKDNSVITYENRDGAKNSMIDASKMDEKSMIEMCCDWASVGAERGNSPQVWFEEGLKNKWVFTQEQQDFIWKILEELWPGGRDETAKISHEERYFNDKVWELLNKKWDEYLQHNTQTLDESYNFGDFENLIGLFSQEKNKFSDVVETMNQRGYEPSVTLPGVGSLQALSFLFSPSVTNYVLNLLDSIINKSYSITGSENMIKSMNLDKVEFGEKYTTKEKITSNFANGIMRALESVNQSKIKNKVLLVTKFINDLKKHAKTIGNKLEKEKYLEDVKALIKVIGIVKNIIRNRNNFMNVLQKTLLLQESNEETVSEMFLNIYEGI